MVEWYGDIFRKKGDLLGPLICWDHHPTIHVVIVYIVSQYGRYDEGPYHGR
tara:strand:+ start:1568 stop:1720 length:153 start_codon:yes stop_codon:yes gene_type:complete